MDREASARPVLRTIKHELARFRNLRVLRVGPEFGQDDELPDGAAVLVSVECLRLSPIPAGLLPSQNRRHHADFHYLLPGGFHIPVSFRSLQKSSQREIADRRIVLFEQPVSRVSL